MGWTSFLAVAISAALLSAGPAIAGVIYDNGGPDHIGAYYGDASYAITVVADNFTLLAGANTIGGINWWGTCSTGSFGSSASCPAGSFTLNFYADSTGLPGGLISSYAVGDANQSLTGNVVGSSAEYSYSATIPNLTLTAGSKFWLGLSDSTSTAFIWGWETTSTVDDGTHAALLFSTWLSNSPDLAFNLTAPQAATGVPEPATLVLFGAGLLALAGMFRRKLRNPAST